MLKNVMIVASLAGVLCTAPVAHAQAMPTATAKGSLQAGGGYTVALPDYAQRNIQGGSGYITFDPMFHFGVEADIHYISLITPTDIAENTFEVGPRYVYHWKHYAPYAKFLLGRGDLVIQESQDNSGAYSGNYFMYSAGAGVDVNVSRHLAVRAFDVEYQRWPKLGHGLSPVVFTVGVAYRFR